MEIIRGNSSIMEIIRGNNSIILHYLTKMRHSIIKIFKADNYEKHVKWNQNTELFVFEDHI